MKYVFVCADISFLTLQYRDFAVEKKYNLITTPGKKRLLIKALNVLGFHKTKALDFIPKSYFKRCFSKLNNNKEKYCFILYSRTYEDFRSTLIRFLRSEYKDCQIVVYYGDLISRHRFAISDAKRDADLVCSFDGDDAVNNSVKWVLEPFSESVVDIRELSPDNNPLIWDVTFVGHAKNRLKKIIEMYELLSSNGLKCDFHITGVEEKDKVYKEEISYEPLNFRELLRHVVSSRCVLEIMQDNGVSPTTRYTEAMLFSRNLLTNCKAFEQESKRPPNVFYYSNVGEVQKDTLDMICKMHEYDKTEYIEQFSINRFVETIGELLNDFKH